MSPRRLPMDEHVQLQLVLEPDDLGDLGPHALGVAGLVQLAPAAGRPGLADLAGVGERADGGRRQRWQAEPASLGLLADLIGAGTVQVGLADRVQPPAHGRVAGPARLAAGGQRPAVRRQLVGDGVGAFGQPTGQGDHLGDLLAGAGQPRPDLRGRGPAGRPVDRDVLERAGGRHDRCRRRPGRVARVTANAGVAGQTLRRRPPRRPGPAADAAGGGQRSRLRAPSRVRSRPMPSTGAPARTPRASPRWSK